MSQGHARMTIGAEHETAAPSLMHSLSRQQDRNAGQNGWLDTVDLGTIVCIPNPVHQKDWACASVKMILEGKCHGEAGFTIYAAQTSSKHIYVWAKRERVGFTNLMNISRWLAIAFRPRCSKRISVIVARRRVAMMSTSMGRPFLAIGSSSIVVAWAIY